MPVSSSVGFFTTVQNDSNSLPPSGEVSATPTIGDKKSIILSVSEISHDLSEKRILRFTVFKTTLFR